MEQQHQSSGSSSNAAELRAKHQQMVCIIAKCIYACEHRFHAS
jgi:hypothetical protein